MRHYIVAANQGEKSDTIKCSQRYRAVGIPSVIDYSKISIPTLENSVSWTT